MKNIAEMPLFDHLEMAYDLEQPVRTWYMATYPSDECGRYISTATFGDVYGALVSGENVYDVLEEADSVIRERVFEKLCDITGASYDEIYTMWLNGEG